MPRRYKPRKRLEPISALNRIAPEKAQEVLTGQVHNQVATDIEERFARSLYKQKIEFHFQVSFFAGRNMPGEVRLDFLIVGLFLQPVQIDGEFAHKSASAKARDLLNDARVDNHLAGSGALPTIRIDGVYLQTQEESDRELAKIL